MACQAELGTGLGNKQMKDTSTIEFRDRSIDKISFEKKLQLTDIHIINDFNENDYQQICYQWFRKHSFVDNFSLPV